MSIPDTTGTVEQPNVPDPPKSNTMKITIQSAIFTATLATNASVTAFRAMLPLTLSMSDFNDNEKVCVLENNLPTNASKPGTIHVGDIMLYGSNSVVLFYKTFSSSYSYTKIGTIDNPSGLQTVMDSDSVIVKFEMQ